MSNATYLSRRPSATAAHLPSSELAHALPPFTPVMLLHYLSFLAQPIQRTLGPARRFSFRHGCIQSIHLPVPCPLRVEWTTWQTLCSPTTTLKSRPRGFTGEAVTQSVRHLYRFPLFGVFFAYCYRPGWFSRLSNNRSTRRSTSPQWPQGAPRILHRSSFHHSLIPHFSDAVGILSFCFIINTPHGGRPFLHSVSGTVALLGAVRTGCLFTLSE
jgi:hypothetical protein